MLFVVVVFVVCGLCLVVVWVCFFGGEVGLVLLVLALHSWGGGFNSLVVYDGCFELD